MVNSRFLKSHLVPVLMVLVIAGSITGIFLFLKCTKDMSKAAALPVFSTFIHNGSGIAGGDIIGNPKAGKKDLPIYNVKTDEKKVALTFDAAWGAEDTIQILDILDKYNVKVTFFMTGGWVDSFPDMVKEIYNRGHDLGNHSQNHKEMSQLSPDKQMEEIKTVGDTVKELTGYDVYLFRPPYGETRMR